MTQYTANIWRSETKCKCGKCDFHIEPYEPVIGMVQGIRDAIQARHPEDIIRIRITSGARCNTYNKMPWIGSSDRSAHTRACAMDFQIYFEEYGNELQFAPEEVGNIAKKLYPQANIGIYPKKGFVHIDTRPILGKIGRRWTGK